MISLEHLRTFRIGPYAIFDIASSFIGVFVLSPLLIRLFRLVHLEIPLLSWMYLTLPLGILAHILVGKNTLMTQYFLDSTGHYVLKIFLVTLLILGIKGIKIIN